jgi:glutathionyl-hydroquinone reductase
MVKFYPAAALACFWGHSQNICKNLHDMCVCVRVRACLPICMTSMGWNFMKFYFGGFLLKSVDQIQV